MGKRTRPTAVCPRSVPYWSQAKFLFSAIGHLGWKFSDYNYVFVLKSKTAYLNIWPTHKCSGDRSSPWRTWAGGPPLSPQSGASSTLYIPIGRWVTRNMNDEILMTSEWRCWDGCWDIRQAGRQWLMSPSRWFHRLSDVCAVWQWIQMRPNAHSYSRHTWCVAREERERVYFSIT